MSSEILMDAETGASDAITAPKGEASPLIISGISDGVAGSAAREVRLNQVGTMVATIAHDLKQHIGIVRGVAELAQEGVITLDAAAMLLRAVDRMVRMLKDLLEFARGVDEVALREVPPEALVRELDEIAFRALAERGIHVERHIRLGGTVLADPDLLVRALANLVTNAAEAMPDGGELTLTVENINDAVVFGIKDTGSGIPEDVLPTIFEPFVTHGKRAGTGLGLAITRDIVEAHRGSVAVSSTVGCGSTFLITIPRSQAGHEPVAAAVQQDAA